ncbi:beta-ketoacyl-ACP synthase II [Dissulfurimicrobium hydrothermale]|uniref:beta-ketoacyl-ACP synthase II n=1 Tax=Dissulfurimicrobium hydrothermale TaxID=1750598 RepID=UPI001EDA0C64|nr:beta-ketoacyl-ACP synthase II [Dissulfurimicrobium hydrothermale]UKL13118.1 beta-ketoacyl-ACP synthase II [Dissulfurimicrobium hydrothermale]
MRRVAITGMGVISPVGNTKEEFFNNLLEGKSGIKRLSAPFADLLTTKIAAEVDFSPGEYFTKKDARTLDRVSQFALVAASQAWEDAGLELDEEEKKRAGVYIGTGMGGARTIEDTYMQVYKNQVKRVSPLTVVMIMNNAPASHLSIQYGFRGPCLTFSTACSSSAVAIGEAFRQIKDGYADVMLAGGAESLLGLVIIMSWQSIGTLAREADDPSTSCRPFSLDRTGFVLGEGAAIFVLEKMDRAKARGARIYGELVGYGSTADATHIARPSLEGQARAISLALAEARLGPGDIDYINAHGTATVLNDIVETQAIKKVFGQRAYEIPISSTKSMHGHLLGATGAVELVASVLAMTYQAVPPTATLMAPDPECDLDYVPGKGRTGQNIRTVMSNSFSFGGTNAVLIVRKYE